MRQGLTVAQAGTELTTILLPQSPKFCIYRLCLPAQLAVRACNSPVGPQILLVSRGSLTVEKPEGRGPLSSTICISTTTLS